MLAGSSTFNSTDRIPGLAWVVASRWPLRRPEMMTWLPRLCSASANPRPIPEPPPVMKIVFPVSFICAPFAPGCDRSSSPSRRVCWLRFVLGLDRGSRYTRLACSQDDKEHRGTFCAFVAPAMASPVLDNDISTLEVNGFLVI